MLLIKNNKPFVFPDSYEKTQAQKDADKAAGVKTSGNIQDISKKKP